MRWYPFSIHPDFKRAELQPYLPIKIIHPEDANSYVIVGALVDTGAFSTKIPMKWAERIGLDVENGNHISGDTAGGEIEGLLCKCKIQVLDLSEKGKILSENILVELIGDRFVFGKCTPIPLLGVKEFLKDLLLTVDYPNKKFSLEKSIDLLPKDV